MEKFLLIYVCVFANTLYADTIIDAWDINQGASVLSSSGEGASSLANMFVEPSQTQNLVLPFLEMIALPGLHILWNGRAPR